MVRLPSLILVLRVDLRFPTLIFAHLRSLSLTFADFFGTAVERSADLLNISTVENAASKAREVTNAACMLADLPFTLGNAVFSAIGNGTTNAFGVSLVQGESLDTDDQEKTVSQPTVCSDVQSLEVEFSYQPLGATGATFPSGPATQPAF